MRLLTLVVNQWKDFPWGALEETLEASFEMFEARQGFLKGPSCENVPLLLYL